ncbi:hypothetical protein QVD17_15242 [Tagetes erecta]|uniref:Uncharacterized protein n=1 Tax=Tagetes erecta TaxID=13708 RepID=A0AAD8KSU8_TARER|nr:hypothetical protein QVD17_15242 [Tagetes erecta]
MTSQSTLSKITLFTHNTIPQLFKPPLHLHTTSNDQLKCRSNTNLKPAKFFCKSMTTPQLQYVQEESDVKHAKLVEVVRELIIRDNISDVKFEDLLMVDALDRLGLDYHYEDEINLILQQCYLKFVNKDFMERRNLYEVSLCFRILRQKGFPVSADVFELFKGNDVKFGENLKYDIRGLMELYEASHLCIEGEQILDEAATFSSHMLRKTLSFLDDEQARKVRYTLENPSRKNFTCFSLVNNSPKDTDAKMLKDLAELEHSMVKSTRRMEINEIIRWCKDIGLEQDLTLARNQPLKWYIVPMVSIPNPTLSQQRIDLTKIVSLIYIIDDIFDIYGTLDELKLLTKAVNMWDINAIDQLPYYMKSSVKAVYDITNEIACKVYDKHGFNPIKSLQNSWATLCEAFLVEANWFASGHIPKSKEYLKNGMVSSGVQVFLVHMLFLLADGVSKENVDLVDNNHGIVSSVSKILRLSDDLESEQDENQDGLDGSYIKCLLMEDEHCSNTIAREHVKKMISDTWKCLNKECLSPNHFSNNLLTGSINLARLVPSMYSYKQKSSFDLMEEYIMSTLCHNNNNNTLSYY